MNTFYVEITVEDLELEGEDYYFAECVGGVSSNDQYPDKRSSDPVIRVSGLLEGTSYMCYVNGGGLESAGVTTEPFYIDTDDDANPIEILGFSAGTNAISLEAGGVETMESKDHYNFECSSNGLWFDTTPQIDTYGSESIVTGLEQDTDYLCRVSLHNEYHITIGFQSEAVPVRTEADPDQLEIVSSSVDGDTLTINFEDIDDASYYADCRPGNISALFEIPNEYDPPAQSSNNGTFEFTDLTTGNNVVYRCWGEVTGKNRSPDVYHMIYGY